MGAGIGTIRVDVLIIDHVYVVDDVTLVDFGLKWGGYNMLIQRQKMLETADAYAGLFSLYTLVILQQLLRLE